MRPHSPTTTCCSWRSRRTLGCRPAWRTHTARPSKRRPATWTTHRFGSTILCPTPPAGPPPSPVESENTLPGAGAYVQLKAPEGPERPDSAGLNVTFGFLSGGIHQVAFIAGLISTIALGIAVVASYWLDEKFKGSSASSLLAAPALVTSLALGFATRASPHRRSTDSDSGRSLLRSSVCSVDSPSLFSGENETHLNTRHGILIGLTALSALTVSSGPAAAFGRPRASIQLADMPSSTP